MSAGGSPATATVIDALAHPLCSDRALRQYLAEPWRRYPVPKPEHYNYPPPFGEYRPGVAIREEAGAARSDGRGAPPATAALSAEDVRRDLLDGAGVRTAVLLPLTRGVLSDPDLDAAVAAATNEWLAAEWLAEGNEDGRLKGSIRVSPRNPTAAVAELKRWASHPHMVQVAVPLQSIAPYGDRAFWPIWEAAAEQGLPIAVHADTGAGIEIVPTALGYPRTAYSMHVQQPLSGVIHLASLVAQGVFARYPSLKWVFADGAYHAYTPIFWRFNNEWRASRFQTPWVEDPPSDHLVRHVRLVVRSTDVGGDPERTRRFLELASAGEVVMFGSGFPYWNSWLPAEARQRIPAEFQDAVFHGNAARLYGLDQP